MKKIIDNLKIRHSFKISQENIYDKKEHEVLKLVVAGLKEMDDKIQA